MKTLMRVVALCLCGFVLACTAILADAAGENTSYVTESTATVIENDVFVMDIPAGVPYPAQLESIILDCCAWVQESSGLSLFPKEGQPKIRITNDGGVAWGGEFGINVENMDYLLDAPDFLYVYLHELTHTAQYRNVYIQCAPFLEGHAILNSMRIAKAHGLEYLYWHLRFNNYSYLDAAPEENEAILADFEHFYRTNEGDWNTYLYGFRFGVYLEEAYGEDIFQSIVLAYAQRVGEETITDQNHFVDFFMEKTSRTVFTDFEDWYGKNQALFQAIPFADSPST